MSISLDVLTELKLGDVLEVPGLMQGIESDEPLLLQMQEYRSDKKEFRMKMTYMNVRLGTAVLRVKNGLVDMEVQ